MPTYQYKCRQCESRLEAVQSFTDQPLTECPSCGGTLRKVFSTVGVVFKGSGFYRNDSRSASANDKSDAAAAKAESASEATAGPKTDGKVEGKAGARSDAKTDAKAGATPDAKPGGKTDSKPATRPSTGNGSSTSSKSA